MTMSEIFASAGRSSRCGEARKRTPSINAEAIQPVTQRPERDPEQLRGGGLVEARGLERLGDHLALDLVEEIVQRQPARAERAVERRHALPGAHLREVEV